MLRLRQAELEQTVTEEQDRLRRVEARLRAIERSSTMQSQDVVIKTTEPLRLAEANDVAETALARARRPGIYAACTEAGWPASSRPAPSPACSSATTRSPLTTEALWSMSGLRSVTRRCRQPTASTLWSCR